MEHDTPAPLVEVLVRYDQPADATGVDEIGLFKVHQDLAGEAPGAKKLLQGVRLDLKANIPNISFAPHADDFRFFRHQRQLHDPLSHAEGIPPMNTQPHRSPHSRPLRNPPKGG